MPLDLLIVDGSPAIRKILQRQLQKAEMPIGQIFQAGDGLEALAVIRANKIGVVLSEVNMPNMDGIQLLGELRANEQWKDIPVVMITTEGSESIVMEAARLGATGYVRKPFTPEQIKDVISRFSGLCTAEN